jgi:hypothetical protein
VIAFDSMTLRGASDVARYLVLLLVGLCQLTGTALVQVTVGAKTNEIPLPTKLLDAFDIVWPGHQRGRSALPAPHRVHRRPRRPRRSSPSRTISALRARLKSCPWSQIPILETSIERGHGSTATRVLKATEIAAGIAFPYAVPVVELTRRPIVDRKTGARPHRGGLCRRFVVCDRCAAQ